MNATNLTEFPSEILHKILILLDTGLDLFNFAVSHSRFAGLVSVKSIDERGEGVAVTLAQWYKRRQHQRPGPLLRKAMVSFQHDDRVCAGMVTALLRLNANPAEFQNDAVEYASRHGLLETVRVLLRDKRVDPSVHENTSIRVACADGHVALARLLLEWPNVDPSGLDNEAVTRACANGHVETVEMLLEDKRVDPSARENSAIRIAVSAGYHEIVRRLLKDERVDPGIHDNFPIRCAVEKGDVDMVRILLWDPRVDPSALSDSAVRKACAHNKVEIAQLLMSHPLVDPSVNENGIIRAACHGGNTEIVQLLLDHPNVDPSTHENTPILYACERGHFDIVRMLMNDVRVDCSAEPVSAVVQRILYEDAVYMNSLIEQPDGTEYFLNEVSGNFENVDEYVEPIIVESNPEPSVVVEVPKQKKNNWELLMNPPDESDDDLEDFEFTDDNNQSSMDFQWPS